MQQKETELQTMLKAAADASRQAEGKFHSSMLSMKEAVRAQFGPNSNAAQSIGYKKKSKYKRPRRAPKADAMTPNPSLKARKPGLRAFLWHLHCR
jgi:hypothetical protein